ncbi:MAG: hypothetical protein LBO74_07880 [Candidatus Symbiothrix sp.]|nr:hypothetical protein [Candidatus Symbiothrix sp.]
MNNSINKSRRDNTLLTVGFSLRYRDDESVLVPQGRYISDGKVSSLQDFIEDVYCRVRRLKPTVNNVLSLRDFYNT